MEHPVPANEDGLSGDAGHLKEQWFQRDVGRSIRCEAYYKEETQGKNININAVLSELQFRNCCLNFLRYLFIAKGEKNTSLFITHRFVVKSIWLIHTIFHQRSSENLTGRSSLQLGKCSWRNEISCFKSP